MGMAGDREVPAELDPLAVELPEVRRLGQTARGVEAEQRDTGRCRGGLGVHGGDGGVATMALETERERGERVHSGEEEGEE
jgi:hypothetical protein